MTIEPDIIFYHANVLTMDPAHPRASAVAVKDEYLIAVGDDHLAGESASRKVDCQGQTLLPGFHDAHLHIISLANTLVNLDCSPQNVQSIEDIKRLIAARAGEAAPGEWIVGESYDEFRLAEKRHPNRHDLDATAAGHPVRLNHRSRHAFALNSRAMELAGISRETEDPPGALIERSLDTGEPTGLMFEMNRYLKNAPPLDEKQGAVGLKLVSERLLSQGITSVQEAGSANDLRQWRLLQQVKRSGAFVPRVTMMAGRDAFPWLIQEAMATGYGNRNLRLGSLKIMLDKTTGRLYPSPPELEEIVSRGHRAGFQVAVHAIEAEDIEVAITAIEKAVGAGPAAGGVGVEGVAQASLPVGVSHPGGRRHRIEHCSVCPDPLLDRIEKAGIVVVTQPSFVHYSGDRYLAKVPKQDQPFLYRIKTLMDSGICVAAGSDTPVVPTDPLAGIYAAVTRRARNGQQLLPGEGISVERALSLYTTNAAYSAFEESYKGSLSPGKLADMVLLDKNPTAVPPEEIREIKVRMTVIGGQICWQSCDKMVIEGGR